MTFISHSILMMTVIDIIMISSVIYLYVLFDRYREIANFLNLSASIAKMLFELGVIQLFYAINLFSIA